MKVLFWIFLLANLVFFAVMQWGGAFLSNGPVVQAQPPLQSEKVRLLVASQSQPVSVQPTPVAVPPPAAASAPAASKPGNVAKPTNGACMEWGDFSGPDLARAGNVLANLQLGDKLGQRQVEHTIGYWVYIAPLKDKAAVNQKVAQLKARGIEEYFVVQEAGQWLNAISLGVFKTQEAAQKYTENLLAKDVHSAQVGERASKLKATVFVFNGLDVATSAKLAALQKDFAGSELKSVSCH